jgi:hypothetical protein
MFTLGLKRLRRISVRTAAGNKNEAEIDGKNEKKPHFCSNQIKIFLSVNFIQIIFHNFLPFA